MKTIFIFFLLLTGLSASVPAQTITCGEVSSYVGQSITICTEVKGVSVDSAIKQIPTLLFLCAPFPRQVLNVVIRKDVAAKFSTSPTTWNGKQICVTGTISIYKGKPEIVVKNKDQIVID